MTDSFVPDTILETPTEAYDRIRSHKTLPNIAIMQAGVVMLALSEGRYTTAQVAAYCDDWPELRLTAQRCLAVLKSLAMAGAIRAGIQPMKAGRRPWRWVWATTERLDGGETWDDVATGARSVEYMSELAAESLDAEDPRNITPWVK